eukprot:CAMPEP_0168171906 /NCGR_PEP_ID=MMETSP0139_2-20121125/4953_1 /TAXON_ID=44445 /ORGANISM="Pseudo-nitzschia australis, Strain 10249 10 AB" /LENGTH=396 /DNA_ID=CAMNT_0008089487 /DNA_START=159 /DNA_END=1346 /DNA_ORIENTATION=+
MLAWASQQIEKISQTVAPPPSDAAGRFNYAVTRNDESTAMGCIAEIDPIQTVVNHARGWFPIHVACQYSMVRLIRLLMQQQGVSIQQPDYAGCTPLHHACMSSRRSTGPEVVKLLIHEYGADPCAKNSAGQTAYDVAALDSVRQYLLPIQLQRETQYALDNGGVGLAPGIDLGGMRISRPNMAPPPVFGAAGVGVPPPTPNNSNSNHARTNFNNAHTPIRQQTLPRAPVSMPSRSSARRSQSNEEQSRYSRTGGSGLAVYSKYKADGFHSSSSDVSLQQKYGNAGASSSGSLNNGNIAPPPDSGNSVPLSLDGASAYASASTGPNPFSGGAGISRYASYGQHGQATATVAPSPASVPLYGGMGFGHPLAAQPAPVFFTPGTPSTVGTTATTTTTTT